MPQDLYGLTACWKTNIAGEILIWGNCKKAFVSVYYIPNTSIDRFNIAIPLEIQVTAH